MKKHYNFLKNLGFKIFGVICILLGIAGLFLPFVQGVMLIALGFGLLGNTWIINQVVLFKKRVKQWWRSE